MFAMGEDAMYKKQITVQKIVCFGAIVACALCFLYALGLMTDLYDGLYFLMPDHKDPAMDKLAGARIYYDMQPFNKLLLNYSIGLLLLACGLFLTNTHSRRRYYVGNAVSTVLFVAAGVAYSGWMHMEVEKFKAAFLTIDFEAYKALTATSGTYIDSTFWFDVHYAVMAVVLVACVLLIANYVWKCCLQAKEKQLIEEGRKAQA